MDLWIIGVLTACGVTAIGVTIWLLERRNVALKAKLKSTSGNA